MKIFKIKIIRLCLVPKVLRKEKNAKKNYFFMLSFIIIFFIKLIKILYILKVFNLYIMQEIK